MANIQRKTETFYSSKNSKRSLLSAGCQLDVIGRWRYDNAGVHSAINILTA